MKLKIFISKERLIILLFIAVYIYCNLVSPLLFPSDSEIFIITKIIPLILIGLFIFPIKKILLNSVSNIFLIGNINNSSNFNRFIYISN